MSSRAQNRDVGNIQFTKEYKPSLFFSLAFQGHRRLYFARCIRSILSLPLYPKRFLSGLEKLHVTRLIPYFFESGVWSFMLLSGRS